LHPRRASFLTPFLILFCAAWGPLDFATEDCTEFGSTFGSLEEEYAVYSAVIEKYYIQDSARVKLALIFDDYPSRPSKICAKGGRESCAQQLADNEPFRLNLPGLVYETIKDFRSRCADGAPRLTEKFKLSRPYKIVALTDLPEHKADDVNFFWNELRKKYEGSAGLISFSRPGFNREATQALIQVGLSWGPLAGRGLYAQLEKTDGAWKVKNEFSYLVY